MAKTTGQVPANWTHKMFNLTTKPSKEKRPHLQARACLVFGSCCCSYVPSNAAWTKKMFLPVRTGFTLAERHSVRFTGTAGAAGLPEKRCITERPTVTLYLNELLIKKCQFGSQIVGSHPKQGCLNWLHGTMSEPSWILH